MSDIVERLRQRVTGNMLLSMPPQEQKDGLCQEAADTIEALRAENARLLADIADWKIEAVTFGADTVPALRAENAKLREALNGLVDVAQYCDGINTSEQLRAARAAMGESDE